MLTGESVPSSKNTTAVPPPSALGDRKCMCYSATTVSSGQGMGVVVATGDNAEIGKISKMVNQVGEGRGWVGEGGGGGGGGLSGVLGGGVGWGVGDVGWDGKTRRGGIGEWRIPWRMGLGRGGWRGFKGV